MKRALVVLVAVVLAVVAVGVYGQVRRSHREAAQRAAHERLVAAHPLEVAAASIESDRRAGYVEHFAIVPQRRPPGTLRMEPSGALADNGVTDLYAYGSYKIAVNFTGVPSEHACADQPCVRNADLPIRTTDAPSLRHVAVWVIGTPAPAEVRKFWATTAWVPIAGADWFTDLAAQGELYAPRN